MFGLIVGVLMLFVGLAVDISRVSNVRAHIQASLDAASLAAAKLLDDPSATPDQVQALAAVYFKENLKNDNLHGARLSNFTATSDFAAGTVQANVDVNLPMYFAPAGKSLKSVSYTPSALTSYKTLRLEVSMVLDNTGSMNDPSADGSPKIQALRTVAKEFIDALYSSNPQPGFVRVGLVPYSAAVNLGNYFSNGGKKNAKNQSSGDTCVIDRDGSQAYTDAPPSALLPLNVGSTALYPRYVCPAATLVPLTDLRDVSLRDTFKASIDSMTANGATSGHIGAAWGWYVLSPNWTNFWGSDAARPYGKNVQKIIILLTDGEFNTAYMNGGKALNSTDAVDPNIAGSSPNQAFNICQNIKNAAPAGEAITIYTIGFTAPPQAETFLRSCSGAANFYSADSSSQLSASFRDIVKKLTILRLSS